MRLLQTFVCATVLVSAAVLVQPAASFTTPLRYYTTSSSSSRTACSQRQLSPSLDLTESFLTTASASTSSLLSSVDVTASTAAAAAAAATAEFTSSAGDPASIMMLSPSATIAVFLVGIFPFGWATVEFWRRIAVGASFGTGADSVVFSTSSTTTIGQDDLPESSRGRRVLGKGALVVAYVLFAVAAAVLGIVLWSVVTTPLPAAVVAAAPL